MREYLEVKYPYIEYTIHLHTLYLKSPTSGLFSLRIYATFIQNKL